MITYNKDKQVFSSKFKQYTVAEVNDALVYQWIKTGELSLPDFKSWFVWKMQQAVSKKV